MARVTAAVVLSLATAVVMALGPGVTRTTTAEAAGGPDMRAVVVGINEFQGRTRPNVAAVGDAMDVREALVRAGWADHQIRMLINGDATAAAMRAGLQWLSENKDPNSHSVFFYSGHTKQIDGDPDKDGEALDEFLWPHDNQFISDGEFSNYLKGIGGYAWIGIAACEAAGFDDGVNSDRRIFTAASAEHEKGYEYPAWNNSIWTGLFIDQGMLQGRADADADGKVTFAEAAGYAGRIAPAMTARQKTGQQSPYFAGGGGDRTFAPPPAPAEAPASPPAPAAPGGLQPICLGTICIPHPLTLLEPR
ncbi:MAG: caspase family protein [Actinomycetota bacterium]